MPKRALDSAAEGSAALPAAASYLACCFGDEARQRVERLLAEAGQEVPVTRAGFGDTWDAGAEAGLRDLIGGCVTGVRIVLAGPEAVVRRAAALARELGAVDEELVLVPEESTGRQVFCSTCRRPFGATGGIGSVVTCPDCHSDLVIDQRFSPAHAAYYGWPASMRVRR